MRVAWVGVVLIACSIPNLDGSEKECPCADGYVCDEARNRCVELDAGVDARDSGLDATLDATRVDGGGRDGGLDARDLDARDLDARDLDAGMDERDADFDAGVEEDDAGFDAGRPGCPYGGLYCTNFEESSPPYVRRGMDGFSAMPPGYMSSEAGYYHSEGDSTFTEFDDVSLPSTVHVRFWMRLEPGSFVVPTVIFGLFLPGGSDEGVLVGLQNESGLISIGVLATAGTGDVVADQYGPPGNMWTCIRLDVRRTRVDLQINDQPEVTTSITPFTEDFDDVSFGILQDGLADSTIVFDEIVVGPDPIPCAL